MRPIDADTDHVRARESVELADLRERLEVFGAFMGGIIMEFDHEFRYVRVWTARPGLLALPAEALIGRRVSEVLGPHELRLFEDAITRLEATNHPTTMDYTLDVADGRRAFSAELRLRTAGGRPPTYMMLIRDVTEEKALEGKLLQTERLAALGLLAASVGHEIRQPLSYLLASLDVVERDLARQPLDERTHASLSNIRTGSRRIAEIASSLDFLAARRERTEASFDIRAPVQAALDLCASELAGLVIARDTPKLPRVRGDESELCQVFANLLLNAAQSFELCPPEHQRRVIVRAAVAGEHVRVEVIDNGAGIPATHLAQVFDPFFTTKERGRGTGLGLFISRSIVESQGGTLRIASEPGKGTRLEILLPIAEEAAVVSPRVPRSTEVQVRRRLHVLIVDDEPRFRESLRLALDADHDVETHDDSAKALEVIESNPTRYEIVVCDMAMLHTDGVTFYERMHDLGVGRRFILMTAGAFTPRAADFISAKRCPIITKPFPIESLLTLLDTVAARNA